MSAAAERQAQEWAETQATAHPEQSELYKELADLHSRKLWYQVSTKLNELVSVDFFQQGTNLLDLYNNFVKVSEKKLNRLDLARFQSAAATQIGELEAHLTFLEAAAKDAEEDAQASLLLKMEITRRKIQAGRLDECKILLEEGRAAVDAYTGIMAPVIHSALYRAALEYHKIRGTAAEYFKNSISYLQYTPLDTISVKEQVSLASDVGLAALVGDNVYNFGELLQHPVVKALENSEFAWLGELLFAFNAGDIDKFNTIYAAQAKSSPVLEKNGEFLREKIRIMAFMEMIFQRPANSRQFSFSEIAKTCQLENLPKAELLLMKSFSLQVVRGIIDQVDETVRVSWVQPRVLDKAQIASVRDRLKDWAAEVDVVTKKIESAAPELFATDA